MAIWIFVPVYFFSSDEKCRIIFYRSLANIDFLLSLVFHGVIKLNLQCTTTQYYPFHVKTLSFFLLHNKAAFVFCILGSRSFASYCPARVGSRVSFFKLSRDFHMQHGLYFAKKKSALQNLKFRGTGCFEDYFHRKRKKCLYCL